ncbi:MAG: branched-chain amino acid ABC transporter permease [Acidimicrobiia bacterium]
METFLKTLFSGVALGGVYALVALGFVIVYRASRLLNFAQGALMLLGGYLAWQIAIDWGWGFWLGTVVAVLATAAFAALLQLGVLRWLIGRAPTAQILATVGILVALTAVMQWIWGAEDRVDYAPGFRNEQFQVFGVGIPWVDVCAIGLAGLVVVAFFVTFRYTRFGIAMRAAAADQEAAMAQGISVRRVLTASWAIAGGLAALACVMLAVGAGPTKVLQPDLAFYALLAFPAAIVGGLDSPLGAVVGGVIIGCAQQFGGTYVVAKWLPELGANFTTVLPFLLMLLILLVRPAGLFGRDDVRRV